MKILKKGTIKVECSSCKSTLEIKPDDLTIRWEGGLGEDDSPFVCVQCPECEKIIRTDATVFPETRSKLLEKAKSENRK